MQHQDARASSLRHHEQQGIASRSEGLHCRFDNSENYRLQFAMAQCTSMAAQCRPCASLRKASAGSARRSSSRAAVVLPRAESSTPAPFVLPRPASLLAAGAMMASVGLGLPSASFAKLPAGMSTNSGNPYADVMKSKPKASAEALYEVLSLRKAPCLPASMMSGAPQ